MYYIGIDLGGTNIVAGLVGDDNKLIDKLSTPTLRERSVEEILGDVAKTTLALLEKHNLDIKDVSSLGIGSPGSCDDENGVVVYSNNLRFKNTKIREILQQYLDVEIHIANDADCAALGEYYAGSGEQSSPFVAITLGTGVGTGVIQNGEIMIGKHFAASEIGHIVIMVGGEECSCGRKGCFEAYCSASALIRDINRAVKSDRDTILKDMVQGDFEHTNAKMVFDAKEEGDEVAKEIVERYYTMLSEGIANIINIFDPETIVIGGGVSAQGDKLINEIETRLLSYSYGNVLNTKIKVATLGNDAGIIGAALIGKK